MEKDGGKERVLSEHGSGRADAALLTSSLGWVIERYLAHGLCSHNAQGWSELALCSLYTCFLKRKALSLAIQVTGFYS